MLKFIANLFATETTTSTPNTKARLSLSAMEDRYAPATLLNPGTIRDFNPQPDPPVTAQVRTTTTNPATTQGFVIEGGRDNGFVIEGGKTVSFVIEGGRV